MRLQFTHQTADLGQASLELTAQGTDNFRGEGAYLNRAGPWTIALYIRRRSMDDILATTTVEVPPPTITPVGSASSLWQNPLPRISPMLVVGGGVVATLLFLLLWRYAITQKYR